MRDLDAEVDLVVFAVELNTHRLAAFQQPVAMETFENEPVDRMTRYLRGLVRRAAVCPVD